MTDREILDSWKEISAYLNRSVKTCQRWETEYHLPIFRLDGSPRPSVFAYKDELDQWLVMTLKGREQPPSETKVPLSTKKGLLPLLVIIPFMILAFVLWRPWSRDLGPGSSADKPSIAILFFENNSGDETLDNWRDAIPELLIADLRQSMYLNTLGGAKVYDVLKRLNLNNVEKYSSTDLENVASESRVSHIIYGSYLTLDEKFIINVSLLAADSAEVLEYIVEEGIGERSIPISVDTITYKVKSRLNLSAKQISDDYDSEAGEIMTYSPQAMKYYSAGLRHYLDAEESKAIPLLEAAVSLDPEFVMAYRHLIALYDNLFIKQEKAEEYRKKMLSLIDRVSQREQYYILGTRYFVERDMLSATKVFQQLVADYPDDYLGHRYLGVISKTMGDSLNAIGHAEIAFQNSPESAFDLGNLIIHLRRSGKFQEAENIAREFIQKDPTAIDTREKLVSVLVRSHKFEQALSELDELFRIAPESHNYPGRRAEIYIFQGEYLRAEIELLKLIDSDDIQNRRDGNQTLAYMYLHQGKINQAIGVLEGMIGESEERAAIIFERKCREYLSYLFLANGDPESALRQGEEARKIKIEDERYACVPLLRIGDAYLAQDSVNRATETADRLKAALESEQRESKLRIYPLLLGKIELSRGNLASAIAHFEEANNYTLISTTWPISFARFLDPLAEAYFESGMLDNAIVEYRRIQDLTDGRLKCGDIYAKSYYHLGKIYEQQGDTSMAAEYYEKFLTLWKNADPAFPEVADARERVAGLK